VRTTPGTSVQSYGRKEVLILKKVAKSAVPSATKKTVAKKAVPAKKVVPGKKIVKPAKKAAPGKKAY
jgi:hypothetical protein